MKLTFSAIFSVVTFVATILSLFSVQASATWPEASKHVENSVVEMIQVIDDHRDTEPLDMDAVVTQIDAIVNRDVDFEYLSKWVMGKYYRRAKPAERAKFAQVFKQTIIKTYAKSLLSFDIKEHKLLAPNSKSPNDNKQIVSMEVRSDRGKVYTLVSYMVKRKSGWKLVNIILNGINLRMTFKNQFADMMQRNNYQVSAVVDSWAEHMDSVAEKTQSNE